MKEKLIKKLYDFWKKDDENYNKTLLEQLNNEIYNNSNNGAETLLDWCRDSYEEYYKENGITQEELEKHCGNVDCGELDNIWNICNWYLDYCNEEMGEDTFYSLSNLGEI